MQSRMIGCIGDDAKEEVDGEERARHRQRAPARRSDLVGDGADCGIHPRRRPDRHPEKE